jgi:hypothetical protein
MGGNRCPWCRGHLSTEYGPLVARCVECGLAGVVGVDLTSRDYEKGVLVVARAVCPAHLEGSGWAGGYGPITRTAGSG